MGHKRPRKFTLRKVRTTIGVGLGALATNVAIIAARYGNADGAYRIMTCIDTWSTNDHTVGEGPILVGYAHGSYTVTQIKEFIESGSSISVGSKLAQEQAGRLIRHVGTFAGEDASETLNDGKPIKTRLNWAIPIGTNLNIFAYNDDGSNLTTGTSLRCNGSGWVKDY